MRTRTCANCEGYIFWGLLCVYCVRAAAAAFAAGFGSALAARWLS